MNTKTIALIITTSLTTQLAAQDSSAWTVEEAVAELASTIAIDPDKRPSRDLMQARSEKIAAWGNQVRDSGLDLGDESYLLTITDYMAGRREDAAKAMFAYVVEHGDFPESAKSFSGFINRMLPRHLGAVIDAGEWTDVGTVIPATARWIEDPYPMLSTLATSLREQKGDEARTTLLQVIALALGDDRISATEKEALLERTFGNPKAPNPRPVRRPRNLANAVVQPKAIAQDDDEFSTVPFTKFTGPSLDGGEISSDDYLGTKVLLIDFWATWCGPCMREMPEVVKLQEKYGDKGLKILGVSLDNPGANEKMRTTMKRANMTWPQIYDGGGWKAGPARLNNVRSIPHTILIDEDGVARFAGLRGGSLEAAIRRMLGDEVEGNADPEQGAYEKLILELGVNQRAHLLMWTSTDDGLAKLAAFRKENPESENLEQVMYLQAIGLWNLLRYGEAAVAYEEYLERFPEEQRSSLSMTRRVQSLIRSDQPEAALVALEKYADKPVAEQRAIHSADALALAGRPKEARAFLKGWIDNVELPRGADRMKDMAREQYERLGLIGKPLSEFKVADANDGSELTPESFRDDVLLVDFWASWCRPCMSQMPHLVKMHRDLHKQGFEILGVSLDTDKEKMKAAVEKVGAPWPMFFDGKRWDNEVAELFDIHRIPFMLLVDRKGVVRAVDPPAASLERLVKELLAER